MGIESFSVTLRAKRTEPIESVRRELESYPHFKLLSRDGRGLSFEYADGECIIEALLRGTDQEAEFDVCVRFALCNPDVVEKRFIEFIRWAKDRWNPDQLWQMTSVSKDKSTFGPDELDEFLKRVPSEVQALRAVWQRAFGPKRGAVRVADAYQWVRLS